ncbi:MAG: hypothetical protein OHK0048_21700 [Rhodoferax sp.]
MNAAPKHRPPPQSEPGARALYLAGAAPKRVAATDAALVVTTDKAQVLRYPVGRVARVVSRVDTVDWSGAALALCLRAGIPITWTDAQGHALGAVYPHAARPTALSTSLQVWAERPDGADLYANWLRQRRMAVLTHWAAQRKPHPAPSEWEQAKRRWVYQAHIDAHLPTGLRGLAQAYVAAQLDAIGLPPHLLGPTLERMELCEDLTHLLWADMNLNTGHSADTTADPATLTALFEKWLTHNGATLHVHLMALQRTAHQHLYD